MELQAHVPNSARYQGKAVVLASLFLGFGFGAMLSLTNARYTEGPAISMVGTPLAQASKTQQFLQAWTKMPSAEKVMLETEAGKLQKDMLKQPMTPQEKLLVEKDAMKLEKDTLKAMAVAGVGFAATHAAHAADIADVAVVSPSLNSWFKSVLGAAVVLGTLGAAIAFVANFDPVQRS